MPRRPKNVSQKPTELDFEDGRDDVLADVLGMTLIRDALYKRVEARAPWGLDVAARDRAMFYLVARGAAILEVAGEKSRTLDAFDVVFLPHGTAHVLRDARTTPPQRVCDGKGGCAEPGVRRIGGDGALTTLVMGVFQMGRVPALLERMPKVMLLSPSSQAGDAWVTSTVQLLLGESAKPGLASVIILQRLIDVLFVQALRSLSSQHAAPGLGALNDPAIHRALQLMHADVAAPWTVANIASRVGLSRSSFAARFTTLVGEPPLQYLARWRIARAAKILRGSDVGVNEVASRVGYESVPSFSKAFKRWQGASPGAFRRAQPTVQKPG